MLRATFATFLLALTALAFAPSADAGPVCDTFTFSPLLDDTWAASCYPPDCLVTTAPLGWVGCANNSVGGAAGYALCYANTAPVAWVPACT